MEQIEHQLKAFSWIDDKIIHSFQYVPIPDDFIFETTERTGLSFLYGKPKIGEMAKYCGTINKNGVTTHIIESAIYCMSPVSKIRDEIETNGFKITREYTYGKFGRKTKS